MQRFVLVALGEAGHAAPAARLLAESGGRHALDVAALRDGDQHLFLRNQVFVAQFLRLGADDGGAPLIAVFVFQGQQVCLDQRQNLGRMREQVFEVGDALRDLPVFLLELLTLQGGQSAQLHVEDGARLALAQAEAADQVGERLVGVGRFANGLDDRVQVVQRDAQAFEDVRALAGDAQLVAAAARDDLAAVVDVLLHHALKRQRAWLAVDQREHVHAKRRLQRRELEQLVKRLVGLRAALELDQHAHAVAVGLVAQVGNRVDAVGVHQFGDALDQPGFIDLERDFSDDNAHAAVVGFLEVRLAAHDDAPAARGVGVEDALGAHDDAAGWEVGTFDEAHQVVERDLVNAVVVIDQVGDAVGDLVQVVRRDVGRHADRNARSAVNQQVGQQRGQHARLLQRAVEVVVEVDRFLVNVGEHLHRDRRETRLGIAHGRGAIAVERAKIALTVHERVAHGEVLRHAHERIVDGHIAVWVVFA